MKHLTLVLQRTGKVIAERVSRYFEDKMKTRKALIEKLRLKNSTLKVQKKKLQMALKQKEDMGEVGELIFLVSDFSQHLCLVSLQNAFYSLPFDSNDLRDDKTRPFKPLFGHVKSLPFSIRCFMRLTSSS